jgi:hypothetical protein
MIFYKTVILKHQTVLHILYDMEANKVKATWVFQNCAISGMWWSLFVSGWLFIDADSLQTV